MGGVGVDKKPKAGNTFHYDTGSNAASSARDRKVHLRGFTGLAKTLL